MKTQVYIEAASVGVLTLIVGTAVSSVLMMLVPRPTDPKDWNKYRIMEISLILTGVLLHLGCEVSGLNGWYCSRGSACSN